MEKFKPKSRDLLTALTVEYRWLNLLYDKNKPYESLLAYIQKIAEQEASGIAIEREDFKLKNIASAVGVSLSKVADWLVIIHRDIVELNETNPLVFKGQGHRFILQINSKTNCYPREFVIWGTHTITQGDSFYWGFIVQDIATGFVVYDVEHIFSGGEQHTYIKLCKRFEVPQLKEAIY